MRVIYLFLAVVAALVVSVSGQSWQTLSPMPVARSDFAVLPVNSTLYVYGGCIGNQEVTGSCPEITNRMETFNTATATWTELPPGPTNRTQYMGCAYGTQLYYVGGRDLNGDLIATVDMYDTVTGNWTTLPDQGGVTNRSNGACFVIGNTLYVVGGYDENYSSLNTTITLTLPGTQFNASSVPSKSISAGDCQADVIGSYGYVFGGFSSQEADGDGFCHPLADIERYDPSTNTWMTLSETGFIGRGLPASGVVDGYLFVMGGEQKGSVCINGYDISHPEPTVQYFNPATNVFTTLDTLPTTRFRFSGAAVGQTLYNIGGQAVEVITNTTMNVTDPYFDSGYWPVSNLVESFTVTAQTFAAAGGSSSSSTGSAGNSSTSTGGAVIGVSSSSSGGSSNIASSTSSTASSTTTGSTVLSSTSSQLPPYIGGGNSTTVNSATTSAINAWVGGWIMIGSGLLAATLMA